MCLFLFPVCFYSECVSFSSPCVSIPNVSLSVPSVFLSPLSWISFENDDDFNVEKNNGARFCADPTTMCEKRVMLC